MVTDLEASQRATCRRLAARFLPCDGRSKVGIGRDFDAGLAPINLLRHAPAGDSSGWFLWAGDRFSEDADFFEPVCVEHLREICPAILPFLGLEPGWRVLIAPDYEDAWFDTSLLKS